MRPTPGPRLVTVLVSGADGESALRMAVMRIQQLNPSRCTFLYTSRTVPGVDAGAHGRSRDACEECRGEGSVSEK